MNTSSDLAALLARCQALEREQAELARFALIGQAFIGLAHELNNALNSMMLQTSVVQMRVDEQGRHELAAIRQHGAQAAGLVRTLQHAVHERREKSYPVDLNSVLTEIVAEEPELRPRLAPSLSPKVPHIHSTHSAVKQLLHLLLEGVCAGTKATVKAATGEQEGGAVLNLTLAGAEGDASTVDALVWQNLDEVGRLAGQSLLRQLGGSVTAERTADARILHVLWRQTP
jgi:nitrogen-specific signal transduction histidine kinase